MSYDSAKNEITVVVTDFDYNEVRDSIADSIKDIYQSGFETDTCGVYAHGRSSCDEPTYTSCPKIPDTTTKRQVHPIVSLAVSVNYHCGEKITISCRRCLSTIGRMVSENELSNFCKRVVM
jgi:hypothetical protein